MGQRKAQVSKKNPSVVPASQHDDLKVLARADDCWATFNAVKGSLQWKRAGKRGFFVESKEEEG